MTDSPLTLPCRRQVIDFGLSNTCDGGKLLKTACGSPCYASPEMIAGHKYVGSLSDMWSMGVILFAMVCGYLPFEHESTSKLYQKILNGEYSTPDFISSQVRVGARCAGADGGWIRSAYTRGTVVAAKFLNVCFQSCR